MGQLISKVNIHVKKSSSGLFIFFIKLLSGLLLGLTLALIGDEIMAYGKISFSLVICVTLAIFLKISKGWGFTGVFVFNLVCVLTALLLRMYILIAPGA